MKYLLVLIFCLSSFIVNSSEVVIQGSIKGFDDKEIRVYVYDDYISLNQSRVATSAIQNGKFRLAFDIPTTQEVLIKVEDKSTILFVEPGKVYNISLSYDKELNRSRIYDKFLNIKLSYPNPTDLNQLIASFNNEYEEFFKKHYNSLLARKAKAALENFTQEIISKEKYQNNEYIKNYIKYVVASLHYINGENKESLKKKYLDEEEVLYKNPEYMNFFKQFFKNRFRQFAISKTGSEMLKAIMFEENLSKALSIIQKGEEISTKVLAELYLLYGLFEDYYVKTVNQKSNKKMLKKIAKNGQTRQNRKIAENIFNSLEIFNDGTKAPNFQLEDEKGNLVGLEDFRGKHVYLNFWASWSVPSLKELKVLNNIYSKYKDKVEFISINLDDDPSKMKELLQKEDYPWTFLHYGNDYEIKEKYQIRTVPSYFLIDEKGNIEVAPAEGPVQFEEKLYNIK